MATRFYLPSSGDAAVEPAYDGSWTIGVTGWAYYAMPIVKTGTAVAQIIKNDDGSSANANCLFGIYVSPKLAAQTIAAQTVSLAIAAKEPEGQNNLYVAWIVRLFDEAGTTDRGDLVAARRDAAEITTLDYFARKDSATSTELEASEGDRIVLDLGVGGDPAIGYNHNCELRVGDISDDMADDQNENVVTTLSPWLNFANTLTFLSEGPGAAMTPKTDYWGA